GFVGRHQRRLLWQQLLDRLRFFWNANAIIQIGLRACRHVEEQAASQASHRRMGAAASLSRNPVEPKGYGHHQASGAPKQDPHDLPLVPWAEREVGPARCPVQGALRLIAKTRDPCQASSIVREPETPGRSPIWCGPDENAE